MENQLELTRCAFVVCKVQRCGEPQILVVRDAVWGDLTLVGGHEEPGDNRDLEQTVRREIHEELGEFASSFRLVPLTREIPYGPTWSKSAQQWRKYVFRYYGIEFDTNPGIALDKNDKGFTLELINQDILYSQERLSNVIKIFLDLSNGDLTRVPVSWKTQAHDCGSGEPKE